MDLLKDLNKAQEQAIRHEKGSLLIVAGAGTGKTTVIARKMAYLINEKKVSADNILALTFTDKAAAEMEERVESLFPMGYFDLWVSTFHSFGERILKEHALDIGLPNNFKLLSETEQWLLMRQHLEDFKLDYYKPKGNPTRFIEGLVKHFSRLKDEDITTEQYLDYAKNLQLNTDSEDEEKEVEVKRINELANAYHVYQKLLLKNNALDFGDLITYCIKLFKERPHILKKYRKKFKYILVDEFQDTNYAQYDLIKILADSKNKNTNLTVVGDDDQCLPSDTKIKTINKQKRIDKIKIGDFVLTAVGKGHTSFAKVSKIFKNRKKARFLTIKTKKGYSIKLTDNHKMFCFVPSVSNKKIHYVYLMEKKNFSWRLGISNDLSTRLRMERGADRIIGIKSFNTEKEARYYELYVSLKYQIPCVCFKARGNIVIQGKILEKLYNQFDTYKSACKLAKDLYIDLNSHHFALDTVNRGDSFRIKIIIEQCYRNYRSKTNKNILKNPSIAHLVSLETSNSGIIKKLRKNNFRLTKAKKGYRLRYASVDFKKINQVAIKLAKITGGIIETRFAVGKNNIQHRKALMMPVKNLLEGHYLPILRKNNEIIYDEIINIKEKHETKTVYDLEIEKTHNFIAENIVVHNSIYKFRGASVSNILEFKKDYKNAKEIVLTNNYRSGQAILDLSYNFIKLNNPNRLENKLNINKKLKAKKTEPSDKVDSICHLHFKTQEEEANGLIDKIFSLKNNKNSWNDFAILIRANNQADQFIPFLERAEIPYQFLASKGLFSKSIILDLLAYLRMLDNYHESRALYRVLNIDIFNLSHDKILDLLNYSKQKNISLFETLKIKRSPETDKILSLIEKHTNQTRHKTVGQVLLDFLQDSGYLKNITKKDDQKSRENVLYLNQFYKYIEKFESSAIEDRSVKNFVEEINMMEEAGERGDLKPDFEEGPETLKIMTVHAAKGLEFEYIFIVNLVDKRFPSIKRSDAIQVPEELVKETIPQGDVHLQEERRLFYVAMTRAKKGLFFTSAEDYGGARKKKLSRFLVETKLAEEEIKKPTGKVKFENKKIDIKNNKNILNKKEKIPNKFSFTQLKAFETCPWQYRFAHILKIPVPGKGSFSFGKTMHNTLYHFFKKLQEEKNNQQQNLFGNTKNKINKNFKLNEQDLLDIYKKNWIDDWYYSKKIKDEYYKKGKEVLKEFYKIHSENWPRIQDLEKGFNLKIDKYTIKGAIDRVDNLEDDSVEILDYKTGKFPKTKKDVQQLLIYALAIKEVFKQNPKKITYYYLEENKPLSFEVKDEDFIKVKDWVLEKINKILKSDFTATPGWHCKYCDFKSICEYKK